MSSAPSKPPEPAKSFGALLRTHRQKRQISLADLARAIEMDAGLLSKIERGLRPPPQIVPYVQQVIRVLGLDSDPETSKELVEAASRGRLGKTRKGRGRLISIGRLADDPSDPLPSGGLGGLPPEWIPPDSPAGRHYRSRGLEVGQRLEGPPEHQEASEAPPTSTSSAVSRQLALQTWAFQVASSMGVVVTKLVQVGDRWEVEFRTLDGREFELVCGPKPSPGKGRKKGGKPGRRR